MLIVLITQGQESKERDKETNEILRVENNQSETQLLKIEQAINNHESNRENQTDRQLIEHENRSMIAAATLVESINNNTQTLIDNMNKIHENDILVIRQELNKALLYLYAEEADSDEDVDCIKDRIVKPIEERKPCEDRIIANGTSVTIDNKTVIMNPFPILSVPTMNHTKAISVANSTIDLR